jgi:hypothetical protein
MEKEKEYVEAVRLSTLKRTIRTELMISMKKEIKKRKENKEGSKSLKSFLVFKSLWRGCGWRNFFCENGFGHRICG